MNYASHLNVRTIQSINFQGTLPSTKLRLDLVPIVNKEALSLTIARYPKSAALPTAMAWETPYTDIGQAKGGKMSSIHVAVRPVLFCASVASFTFFL